MNLIRRDYAIDRRVVTISVVAAGIGLCSTISGFILLAMIRVFTNLFFFQTFSFADRSPAVNTLGGWVILVPVAGGLAVGLIARFGSEKIRGHGIPEAIEAILFGRSQMSPKIALLKPLSSGIVMGSGGPFGAEGPIIMTGGAIGSLIAQCLHLSGAERKTLLVAGACAGMSAIFGTPLAAVLLAVELLLFELRPRSLLPVIAACSVAGFFRIWLFPSAPLFPIETPVLPVQALLSCVLAGLASGVGSTLLTTALHRTERLFEHLPLHWMWWPAVGGIAVGVGGYLQPRALGIGYDVITDLLHNKLPLQSVLALMIAKAGMWITALASGTSGGVLAPVMTIGSALGIALSPHLPGAGPDVWALVCMAATLGAALGAPLTVTVFAFGLTHDVNVLLPVLLATATAYGFSIIVLGRSIMTDKIVRRGHHIYREYGVDPLEHQHVEDVMTREVVKIDGAMPLDEIAAKYFGRTQRHRAYPVVAAGRVVGMLDRELINVAVLQHLPSASAAFDVDSAVVALPHETCRIAAARMAVHRLERLPVVADLATRRLVGVVSRSDLIKPSLSLHDEELSRQRLIRDPSVPKEPRMPARTEERRRG